jgi:hypothetical protein
MQCIHLYIYQERECLNESLWFWKLNITSMNIRMIILYDINVVNVGVTANKEPYSGRMKQENYQPTKTTFTFGVGVALTLPVPDRDCLLEWKHLI